MLDMFVRSLRWTGSDADVVIFTHDIDASDETRAFLEVSGGRQIDRQSIDGLVSDAAAQKGSWRVVTRSAQLSVVGLQALERHSWLQSLDVKSHISAVSRSHVPGSF